MAQPSRKLVLDQVGSTNREAFALAACGETGPLWIVARRQTAGRGRSGRRFVSEPGNLSASLLVKLACPAGVVPQLSLLAGVATVDAIRQAAGGGPEGLRLKWPNDVLIGFAKCAGILAESLAAADSVVAVIGIGLNLASHPADLGRDATHLGAHGVQISPEAMLDHLDEATRHWLAAWERGNGFARVRAAWLERAGPTGERCTVNTGAEQIAGTFLDLDADGALRMQDTNGRQRTLTFGDVTLVPALPQEASR